MFPVLRVWEDFSVRKPSGHMAVDEALLQLSPVPVIRFYRWEHPAVTFGYAQRYEDVLRVAGALSTVRRWTGGGTVFHGHDLTVALAVPRLSGFTNLRTEVVYRKIHASFLRAIRSFAPGASLAAVKDCRPGAACFESPALSDILCDGMKICGGALRRGKAGILYQGSLHANVPPSALAKTLTSSIEPFDDPSQKIGKLASRLEQEKYSSDDWIRMR